MEEVGTKPLPCHHCPRLQKALEPALHFNFFPRPSLLALPSVYGCQSPKKHVASHTVSAPAAPPISLPLILPHNLSSMNDEPLQTVHLIMSLL